MINEALARATGDNAEHTPLNPEESWKNLSEVWNKKKDKAIKETASDGHHIIRVGENDVDLSDRELIALFVCATVGWIAIVAILGIFCYCCQKRA